MLDPVLAIQSVGNGGDPAEYHFTSAFTILQQGNGHWGGTSTSLSQVGNILYGREGNGIIQFSGVFSTISWTVPNGENYHMFTVGAPASASPRPRRNCARRLRELSRLDAATQNAIISLAMMTASGPCNGSYGPFMFTRRSCS